MRSGAPWTDHEPPTTGERTAASLLVRCWLEPTGREGGTQALRGYVRNLKTGEEMSIKDLDAVGQQIRRQLTAGAAASESQAEEPIREGARKSART